MTKADVVAPGPVPAALVAVTVNLYGVPLVSPWTVHVVAPEVLQLAVPGEAFTVYSVIVPVPLDAGCDHETASPRTPTFCESSSWSPAGTTNPCRQGRARRETGANESLTAVP